MKYTFPYADEHSLVDNAVEHSKADLLTRRAEVQKELSEKQTELHSLEKGITEALSLYGPAAPTHMQIVYTEAKSQRDILKAYLLKLRPSAFTPERLKPAKKKELAAWKGRCRSLVGEESQEKLAAALFEKISVSKGFRISYSVTPDVSQFFGFSVDFDTLTVSEPQEEQVKPLPWPEHACWSPPCAVSG